MRTGRIALILCLLLSLSNTEAAERRNRLPRLDWGLSVSASSLYNDNILRFSERDENRFRTGDESLKTSLETVDDVENEFQINPSFRWRAPHKLMLIAHYRLKFVHRVKNNFTDYQTHSLSLYLRPRVSGYKWVANFSVFAIPSFYLRVYRDRDLNEWHAARFSNWLYRGSTAYRISDRLRLEGRLGYGTYYYNSKFTEYDSEYFEYTGGCSIILIGDWTLQSFYTRRISDNIGSDQITLTAPLSGESLVLEDTEYGDSDYHEDDINLDLSGRLRFIKLIRTRAGVDFRFRRRVYTTDRPLDEDPFHRSRLDRRGQLTPSLTFAVHSQLDLLAYFTYEERQSTSDYSGLPPSKDFIRREIGLVLKFQIR